MNRPGPITRDWNDVEQLSTDLVVPFSKRLIQITKEPGTTTLYSTGIAAPTTDGTVTSNDLNGPLLDLATAAPANSIAGIYTAFTVVQRGWTPSLYAVMRTGGNIGSVRYWIGFFSADPGALASAATIHAAGFNFDTGNGDASTWRIVTSDGATATKTNTAAAIGASTLYKLRIDLDAAGASFWVDGQRVGRHTANLPGSTQNLGYAERVSNLVGVSRKMFFGALQLVY